MSNLTTRSSRKYSYRARLKCILVLSTLPIIAYLGFLIKNSIKDWKKTIYCDSMPCYETFRALDRTIDLEKNPCNNWYEYICGGLGKPKLHSTSPLEDIESSVKDELQSIVTNYRADEDTLSKNILYMRKFYRSCVKVTDVVYQLKCEGKHTICQFDNYFRGDIFAITGGWPLYKLTDEVSHWKMWSELTLRAKERGYFYGFFLDVNARTDPDTGKGFIVISPPSLQEFKKHDHFWSKDENVKHLVWMLDPNASYELYMLPLFRKELAEVIKKAYYRAKMVKSNFGKSSIHEMSQRNTVISTSSWIKFLTSITNNTALSADDLVEYQLDKNQYFEELSELWQRYGPWIGSTYMVVELLLRDCDLMGPRFRLFCYMTARKRPIYDTPRGFWHSLCYKQAKTYFPGMAEAQYIRDHTTKDTLEYVSSIIQSTSSAIVESLDIKALSNKYAMLRGGLIKQIIKYFDQITTVIGGPDILFDDDEFEKEFGILEGDVEPDDFYKFRHIMAKSLANYNFKKLTRLPKYNREYEMFISNINVTAAYYPIFNTSDEGYLYISPALLQMPLFSLDRELLLNYGALGSIISNAMLLGIGRNLMIPDDFSNGTKQQLIPVYLKLTLGCNMRTLSTKLLQGQKEGALDRALIAADMNAAEVAYQAFETINSELSFKSSSHLIGLFNSTPHQLFWMMSSFYMCQHPKYDNPNVTAKLLRKLVPFNYYTTPSFRLTQPKQVSETFSKDFSCSKMDRMNNGNCECGFQVCPEQYKEYTQVRISRRKNMMHF